MKQTLPENITEKTHIQLQTLITTLNMLDLRWHIRKSVEGQFTHLDFRIIYRYSIYGIKFTLRKFKRNLYEHIAQSYIKNKESGIGASLVSGKTFDQIITHTLKDLSTTKYYI